jgi:hypothetical protein
MQVQSFYLKARKHKEGGRLRFAAAFRFFTLLVPVGLEPFPLVETANRDAWHIPLIRTVPHGH